MSNTNPFPAYYNVARPFYQMSFDAREKLELVDTMQCEIKIDGEPVFVHAMVCTKDSTILPASVQFAENLVPADADERVMMNAWRQMYPIWSLADAIAEAKGATYEIGDKWLPLVELVRRDAARAEQYGKAIGWQ